MNNLVIDTASNLMYNKQNKDIKNINDLMKYYEQVVDKNVTGWFFPIDIVLAYWIMCDLQKTPGDICELGVAFGKSAVGLSLIKKPEDNLYLFDNFAAEITPEHAKGLVSTYGKDENLNWNVVDLMKLKSEDLNFKNSLRYLHIDACHLHNAVFRDLKVFSKYVGVDDGIIVVDDWNDQEYPGINTAVTQFCLSPQGKNWTVFFIGQNKAYLCKRNKSREFSVFLVNKFKEFIPDLGLTLTEFIDNPMVMVGSRSPVPHERIIDILEGKLELLYT